MKVRKIFLAFVFCCVLVALFVFLFGKVYPWIALSLPSTNQNNYFERKERFPTNLEEAKRFEANLVNQDFFRVFGDQLPHPPKNSDVEANFLREFLSSNDFQGNEDVRHLLRPKTYESKKIVENLNDLNIRTVSSKSSRKLLSDVENVDELPNFEDEEENDDKKQNNFICPSISDRRNFSSSDWVKASFLLIKLLREMNINEAYLCSFVAGDEAYLALRRIFPKYLIYTGGCDADVLARRSQHRRETVSSIASGIIPMYRHRSAIIYLTAAGFESTVMQVMSSHDLLTVASFQSIIFGPSVPTCLPKTPIHTSSWLQVTYKQDMESLVVEEVFAFTTSKTPVFTTLGTVSFNTSTHNDSVTPLDNNGVIVDLNPFPAKGPLDFRNQFVKVTTKLAPPYVLTLPTDCLKPKRKSASGEEEIEQKQLCRFAHKAWRRVYLVNDSAEEAERVPVQSERPLYGGYLIDILLTLAHKLNFRVLLVFPGPGDQYFGLDHGNGSFSGLVGLLQRKEAELGLASFTMTRDRLRVIDFSTMIDRSSLSLFINREAVVSAIGWNTYVLSFHWTSWLSVLIILILTSFVFLLMVRNAREEDCYFQKANNVTFILFSCIVQQGSGRLPITANVRAVLMVFWLACIVLYAFYTARLTSHLTTSSTTVPFTSLAEAVVDPNWKVGLLAGTSTNDVLRRSEGDAYKILHRQVTADPSLKVDNDTEGLQRILSENYAYFCEKPTLLYLLQGNCSVLELPGEYLSSYLHIGYSKHLPFANVLNDELFKLLMGGVLERLKYRWWGKGTVCSQSSLYTELDFSNIVTAYLILGVGMVVAVAIFYAEIITTRWSSSSFAQRNLPRISRQTSKLKVKRDKPRALSVVYVPAEQQRLRRKCECDSTKDSDDDNLKHYSNLNTL